MLDDRDQFPVGAVLGHYDVPMWKSIKNGTMELQCCSHCNRFHYPPGPACPHCLSSELVWKPISGQGKVVSWIRFERTYLDNYPAPYKVVAVRLSEGPVIISNLHPIDETACAIGAQVSMVYTTLEDNTVLPRFKLIRP